MPFDFKPKLGHTEKTSGGSSRISGLTQVLVGIIFCALLYYPGQAVSATLSASYSLTLSWNPSPSPEVAGYHLYYGTASGNYSEDTLLGNETAVTVSGRWSGVTYYFAMTAVGTNGLESGLSSEVSYRQELPGAQIQIHGVSDGPLVLTVTGPTGQSYDIEATQNFTNWTAIGTVTLGAGATLDFSDTNAVSFPQRFYRTRETP